MVHRSVVSSHIIRFVVLLAHIYAIIVHLIFLLTCDTQIDVIARVQCGLTDEGGYGCNGCGDYSSGQACFDFECSGGDSADCTCNSITWNGQDCGECSIDSNDNPIFDCSAVDGPGSDTSSSHVVGASAAMLAIAALGVLVNAM